MSWFAALFSFFRPAQTPSVSPSKPTTAAPAPIEDMIPTPAVASPAWYPLCEALTKASESCVLTAYPDPASGGDPWTCGYGATGAGIEKGTVWTAERAEARLTADLMRFAAAVDSMVTVSISPQQKAALVDFAFNVGSAALESSTLLRLLNNGAYESAANQFTVWNLAAGRVMPGLVKRRARERGLFLTGTWV